MAERVDQGGDSTVRLVGRLTDDLGAFVSRSANGAVDVVDLKVQRVAVRPTGFRCVDTALEPRIGQHQHGIADGQFGVPDRAVGALVEPAAKAGGEDLGVPVDRLAGAADGDVRRERRRPGDIVADLGGGEIIGFVELDLGHVVSFSGGGGGQ